MKQIVLLRGINLGARNRIAMQDFRELLGDAGFEDVRTHLQSGNAVLRSDASPEQLSVECARLITERFGLAIDVVVRTREELAAVVRRNPLGEVAIEPKRYQVSFCSAAPDREVIDRLAARTVAPEQFVAIGRELYAWHPDGVARSKLWAQLAGKGLGVTATARNWTTVTKLLELAAG